MLAAVRPVSPGFKEALAIGGKGLYAFVGGTLKDAFHPFELFLYGLRAGQSQRL